MFNKYLFQLSNTYKISQSQKKVSNTETDFMFSGLNLVEGERDVEPAWLSQQVLLETDLSPIPVQFDVVGSLHRSFAAQRNLDAGYHLKQQTSTWVLAIWDNNFVY